MGRRLRCASLGLKVQIRAPWRRLHSLGRAYLDYEILRLERRRSMLSLIGHVRHVRIRLLDLEVFQWLLVKVFQVILHLNSVLRLGISQRRHLDNANALI